MHIHAQLGSEWEGQLSLCWEPGKMRAPQRADGEEGLLELPWQARDRTEKGIVCGAAGT